MGNQPDISVSMLARQNDCFDVTFKGGAARAFGPNLRIYFESEGYSIVVRKPTDADVTVWEVTLPLGEIITSAVAEKIESMVNESVVF